MATVSISLPKSTTKQITRLRAFLAKATAQHGYWVVQGWRDDRLAREYRTLHQANAVRRMNEYVYAGLRPFLAWQALRPIAPVNDGLLTGAEVDHA